MTLSSAAFAQNGRTPQRFNGYGGSHHNPYQQGYPRPPVAPVTVGYIPNYYDMNGLVTPRYVTPQPLYANRYSYNYNRGSGYGAAIGWRPRIRHHHRHRRC